MFKLALVSGVVYLCMLIVTDRFSDCFVGVLYCAGFVGLMRLFALVLLGWDGLYVILVACSYYDWIRCINIFRFYLTASLLEAMVLFVIALLFYLN